MTDSGGVFYSKRAMAIYEALDIRKERIDPRQSWQNYIEAHLYVMWNLENSLHNWHYVDLTLDSCDIFEIAEGQFHIIGIMRRLADYYLNKAPTLDEMKKAHRKFIRDYNCQIGVTILNGVKHTLSYECASQEVSLEGMKGL